MATAFVALFLTGFSLIEVYGREEVDLDYFDPRFKGTLMTVEKYHLTPSTFWKHYSAREYNYALGELKFVLRYFPNHPEALVLLGGVARLKKTPSVAVYYYERAIMLYPQYALTHGQYGNYLVGIDELEKGMEQLRRAIQIDPKLPIAYVWLSEAYDRLGDSELARQAADKAKELGVNVQDRSKQPRIE